MSVFNFRSTGKFIIDLELTNEDIVDLSNFARDQNQQLNYIPVFLDTDDVTMDPYRQVCNLKIHSRSPPCIKKLKRLLLNTVHMFDKEWRIFSFQILHSLPHGNVQAEHADFIKLDRNKAPEGHSFASCLIAVEDSTTIITNGEVLSIPKGYCIISKSNFLHAGAAYQDHNYRYHALLSFDNISTVGEEVQPAMVCCFCKNAYTVASSLRGHRRVCKLNPNKAKVEAIIVDRKRKHFIRKEADTKNK
jgi:hypothetical protein